LRTLIRHAFCVTAATISLLTVAMIQPALDALLMTTVGGAMLAAAHMAAALARAVPLPAITARANPKDRPAIWVEAKPPPENNFSLNRHTYPNKIRHPLASPETRIALISEFTTVSRPCETLQPEQVRGRIREKIGTQQRDRRPLVRSLRDRTSKTMTSFKPILPIG
jgi:hypothetical protein